MVSSNDVAALLQQASKLKAAIDKLAAKLADERINNHNKLPLLSPQNAEGDIAKPTVSDLPTNSLCNYGVKESQFSSSLPENDTKLTAHQVFDINPDPKACFKFGLSVNTVGIDLGNVNHPACHDHYTINNIESVGSISCDKPSETKDGINIRDAHKVLDEIPLPEFIREMADYANITPNWNSIECGYKSPSHMIQNVQDDSLAYERQLFAELSAHNMLDEMSQPVLSLRQNLIATFVIENTLVSRTNEVGVVGEKILRVPPMRSEEQLVALVEDDNKSVDVIRKLPMAIDDFLENHLIVCCQIAINKSVNSFPFDPGELNYNPSIFKTRGVVSTDQRDAIVVVWVFDPGGYCDLLRVPSANMVMTFRGNIKRSTTMVKLDPCVNDQELRKIEQLDCNLEGAYGSCHIFVFDPGGWYMAARLYLMVRLRATNLIGQALFGTQTLDIIVLTLLHNIVGLGIAIVNDFKSVEGDRAIGLQSIPVAFGTEAVKWICVGAIDITQLSVAGYL